MSRNLSIKKRKSKYYHNLNKALQFYKNLLKVMDPMLLFAEHVGDIKKVLILGL